MDVFLIWTILDQLFSHDFELYWKILPIFKSFCPFSQFPLRLKHQTPAEGMQQNLTPLGFDHSAS